MNGDFEFNPIFKPATYNSYKDFVKGQIDSMDVGEKKIIDLADKDINRFRIMIWKLYPTRSGVVYRTKTNPKTGELWVARVQ